MTRFAARQPQQENASNYLSLTLSNTMSSHSQNARAPIEPGQGPPKLNYIILLNSFWQYDTQRHFGASATRLYFFLLQECNRQRWTNPFTLADAYLCLALGMVKNTMKPARAELVNAGLISFQGGGNGRGDATCYQLRTTIPTASEKGVDSAPFTPALRSRKEADSALFQVIKGAVKGAVSDTTIYKKENKTRSENKNKEEEATPSSSASQEKWRNGKAVEKKDSTLNISSDASASHTRGGAAHLVAFADSEFATTAGFTALAHKLMMPQAYAPYYLSQIKTQTEGMPLRTPAGWRNFVQRYLQNDAKSRTGLITCHPDGTHNKISQVAKRQGNVHDARLLLQAYPI
ncbi:hypothetical protein LGH70_22615 [Hymenobacter sp. BT635]|uniref:Helix-turn-helix domain-containing protein n=1 Tax=Hymenobacter nitidus TaxID=2880929 RepID=A0ABS8AIZ0_9BACT|nr:hypothetical protein [Hymenobacter nitidus]MCB2380403.1 hypothetical protein [Hymenobacter nitidus]